MTIRRRASLPQRRYRNLLSGLAAAAAMTLSVQALAGEVSSVSWMSGSQPPQLKIAVEDNPGFTTESLDNGRRLRLTLTGATLGDDVVDISGSGDVKGVFPYMSDDGEAVIVDVLMEKPGRLEISPAPFGFVLTPVATAMAMDEKADAITAQGDSSGGSSGDSSMAAGDSSGGAAMAAGNVLEDVRVATRPGGRIQIDLRTTQRPGEPGRFSTSNPPRVAFDLFRVHSQVPESSIQVGKGLVDSINVVETGDRTRVVVNLLRPTSYETRVTDDGVVILISGAGANVAATTATRPTTRFSTGEPGTDHEIANVDFRRGSEGQGQVIVELSDPDVGIDLREEAGEIIVDFLNTTVPDSLEQRLDVIDFATPVQTIDTFATDGNARMVIRPTGNYDHLAYQSGTTFTVHVRPLTEEEVEREVDEFGYSGEKLSLNFQDISVRAALQVIADFTGLNFVTSDSVTGSLTLRLQDVPWDQALDIILQTKGLGMRRTGNVVWVAPAQEIAAKERAQLEANKQVRELEPLVSELIQVNYAKAGDIAKILKSIKAVETGVEPSLFGSVSVSEVETESNSLLSPRGNVTVDNRTNTLLIQDTADKIREVRKLISQLDKPVRQVMIETRIVEANDDFSRSLGARVGFNRITEDARFPGSSGSDIGDVAISGNLEGAVDIQNNRQVNANTDGLNVDLATPGILGDNAASYAINIAKAGPGFAHIIQLELSALEFEGKGKIIAQPRLITANQKEAHIEQGQERVFTTNVLGVGSVVTKKAVLGLTVTPQITPDDRLILDVFITQDTFASLDSDTINTKQVRTQVLLDNGETVVIGGIYQQELRDDTSKVPILGDLPVVGALFRKNDRVDNRTELLVFLTPRIINPALNI